MSSTKFIFREISRNRRESLLLILSVWSTTASTSFIPYLTLDTFSFTPDLIPTYNLSQILLYDQLLYLLWVFSFLIGITSLFSLFQTHAMNKRRDIALSKAIGGGEDYIYGAFLYSTILVVILGLVGGLLSGYTLGNLLALISAQNPAYGFPLLSFIVFLYLVFIYVAAYRPMIRTVNRTTVAALENANPSVAISPMFGSWFRKRHPLFRFAIRNSIRTAKIARRYFITLFLVFVFLSTALYGYATVADTAIQQTSEGYGSNIVIIASPTVCNYLQILYGIENASFQPTVNLTDPVNCISQSAIQELLAVSGVEQGDPRSLVFVSVKENPSIKLVDGEYVVTGGNRTTATLIVGVNSSTVFLPEELAAITALETNPHATVIGDTLANVLFDDPLSEYLVIGGQFFNVTEYITDPLARGRAAYISQSSLEAVLGYDGINGVWVKINSSSYEETLELLKAKAETYSLQVLELDPIKANTLESQSATLRIFWAIPVLLSITTVAVLFSYLSIAAKESILQYVLAWRIGIPKKSLAIALTLEMTILLAIVAPSGVFTGLILSYIFFTQNPFLSNSSFIIVTGWLLGSLLILMAAIYLFGMSALRSSIKSTML